MDVAIKSNILQWKDGSVEPGCNITSGSFTGCYTGKLSDKIETESHYFCLTHDYRTKDFKIKSLIKKILLGLSGGMKG